jgi:hypothetical protein
MHRRPELVTRVALSNFEPTYANTEWTKSLCAPDDYSKKNMQKNFKQFQSRTMIT